MKKGKKEEMKGVGKEGKNEGRKEGMDGWMDDGRMGE